MTEHVRSFVVVARINETWLSMINPLGRPKQIQGHTPWQLGRLGFLPPCTT